MKFSKDLIGKTICAIPTGNNALRGSVTKSVEFVVVSLARKYVELKRVDYDSTDEYCTTTGATKKSAQGGYSGNGGYLFFETAKECSDFQERTLLATSMKTAIIGNHGKIFNNMCIEDLRKIEEILSRQD